MKTPLILFVGLTVATCVIAYWSDNLGKKLGKKRISLCGLRPRQTATILSMASSWLIMVLTLVVLVTVSSDLRRALLYYDAIQAQNIMLRKQSADLKQRGRVLADDVQRTEAHYRLAQGRLLTAQTAQRDAETAKTGALTNLDAARDLLGRTRDQLAQSTNEYNQVKNLRDQAQAGLVRAQARLGQAESRLLEVGNRLAYQRAELKSTQQELDSTKQLVGANMHDALKSIEDVAKRCDALVIERQQLEGTVRQLEQTVAGDQHEVELLQQNLASLNALTHSGTLTLPINQALAVSELPPHPTSAAAAAAVHQLIAQADGLIQQKFGAKPLQLLAPSGGGNRALTDAEITALLVSYLGTSDTRVSVRLVAAVNHFQGDEKIYAQFVTVPERFVYNRGDTIASSVVDGSQSDAHIFNQLLDLMKKGQTAAGDRGVNPPQSLDNPAFFADGTNERIFGALRHIQNLGGSTEVRLIAEGDISTIAPAPVRFEVRESPAS